MIKCFQNEEPFVRWTEEKFDGRKIHHMNSASLEKFMKLKCPYNTILFKGDGAFEFQGTDFQGAFLSFKTDEPITFTECNFTRDMIIRNEGNGAINIVKASIGGVKETNTGSILTVTSQGNICLDQVNDVQLNDSTIKVRANEGTVFMHRVVSDTPIVVAAKFLHTNDCNANIVLDDVKRYISENEPAEFVPAYVRKKDLSI